MAYRSGALLVAPPSAKSGVRAPIGSATGAKMPGNAEDAATT